MEKELFVKIKSSKRWIKEASEWEKDHIIKRENVDN
jgi:hypothetical protein